MEVEFEIKVLKISKNTIDPHKSVLGKIYGGSLEKVSEYKKDTHARRRERKA